MSAFLAEASPGYRSINAGIYQVRWYERSITIFTVAIIFTGEWRSQTDIDRTISYHIIHVIYYWSWYGYNTQQKPYQVHTINSTNTRFATLGPETYDTNKNPVRWVFIRIYNERPLHFRPDWYNITTINGESIYLVFSSNKYVPRSLVS